MALEWWVIAATLAGPVVAVQTQKWIEKATQRRDARRQIFYDLMANRASRLNDAYIRALNQIDLEFSHGSKTDKAVIAAWQALFGELTNGLPDGETDSARIEAWNTRVSEKLVTLLSKMSLALGFSMTDEQLRRGVYYPRGRVELELAQLALVHGMRDIVDGKRALPIDVKTAP
jgi:hypothetical protein